MDAKKIFFPEPCEQKILDLGRMARKLGVSQAWLRAEVEAGRIPALDAGGRLLFQPEAVEGVLADRAAKPTPDPARPGREGKA